MAAEVPGRDILSKDEDYIPLGISDSPTQSRGKFLQVEIFNDVSEGKTLDSLNLDNKWGDIKKETCEAGKIVNSVCLKLLRGNVNYSLMLEKVLEKIIYLLNSEIGVVTAVPETPRNTGDSQVLVCLALSGDLPESLCPFDKKGPFKGMNKAFGHSIEREVAVISNDVENDPRIKKNLPSGHPQVRRFISVPLKYHDRVAGIISVANSSTNYKLSSVYSILPLLDLCSNLLVKSMETKETLVSRIQSINQADEAKDKFLSTMSHELRTPLNGIMGMVTLFPDAGPLNTKQREYIKNLTECTIKLTGLLNNILDFSKMSSDRLSLKKEPFLIQDAVDDSKKMIGGVAFAKEIDIQINFNTLTPLPKMVGDRQRLVQVLSNLLSNSVKFTDQGSITLTINAEIISKEGGPRWKITFNIKDTGIGIPLEEQDKVFEVFYQSSNLTSFLSNSGTGLGLPISQELVRLMGGKISVRSEGIPGMGSLFTFYIILNEEIDISMLQKEHINIFTDARILIVDDRPEMRLQLSDILFKWKCIPQAVSSADEALQYLQYGMKFRAALIDINMPQMSGVELAQELREKYPGLPLIGLSSIELKGGETYFDFYMYKPIDQNTLFPALLQCMTKSRKKLASLSYHNKRKTKKNLKILVAEDDPYNRFTIKEMLINLGYNETNIVMVEDGLKCVQEVKENKYDVILMDIIMPCMGGLEATRRIKRLKSPPMVIAVSAAVQPSDKEKCQGVGIDGYLPKPIEKNKLEASLYPLIKNRKRSKKSDTN